MNRCLVLCVLVCVLVGNPSAVVSQNTEAKLYLALVQKPALAEVVVTAVGEYEGYPTTYYAYGYMRNLTGVALRTELAADVTIYPYEPLNAGDTPEFQNEIFTFTPAFTVTLPNQLNPFAFSFLLGKASAMINDVHLGLAEPWHGAETFAALSVTTRGVEGTRVYGTVRNDSEQALNPLYVIFASPICYWQKAALDAAALAPGQETNFSVSSSTYCLARVEDGLIVGQGKAP